MNTKSDLELILENSEYILLLFWFLIWLPTTNPIAAIGTLVCLGMVAKRHL